MSDIFKEVDEDIRREQLHKLWDRFGPYILGVAVLIVLVTAGYRGWEYWQERQAQASGDRFATAIQLATAGKHDDAIAALQAIVKDGSGGYPVLAQFRIAGEKAAKGDDAGAVADFDAIAAGNAPAEIKNMARLRAAFLLVDTASFADLSARVGDLATTGNIWRHTAREILGLAAWRTGDYTTAQKFYSDLDADTDAPDEVHQRARLMLALIDAKLGVTPPADAASITPATPTPPDATPAPATP
ncbi:MAG: tetratricopeptide repeat protein [Bauldia sp.]